MKNEFISIVSHELRTPLTSIHGSLSLLLNDILNNDLPEKSKQLLEIAEQNTQRLVRLINDILDIEKIETGRIDFNLKALDINALAYDAFKANEAYAHSFDIKLQFNSLDKKISIYGDYDRLLQVFTNLISNAVKFSPKKETVIINIKEDHEHVIVSITDRGEGIPKAFQSQVFQKFSQADASITRQKGGTGLGLSICKSIIDKLGGHINFETERHQGTTFYFKLPLLKD